MESVVVVVMFQISVCQTLCFTHQAGSDKRQGSHLNRIIQLTGFSDPVYAEAYVTVHQYDIVLDVMVINRTQSTMQNLCLELATMGDLKVGSLMSTCTDRPPARVLGFEGV